MKIIIALLFFTVLHFSSGEIYGEPVIPKEFLDNKVKSAPLVILYPIYEKCEFRTVNYMEQVLNTYVKCIELGTDSTWLIDEIYDVRKQGEKICNEIKMDENLKNGNFSIMAMSLGGMMARYLIQYCDYNLPVRNVVTIGSPLNGISAITNFGRDTWLGYVFDALMDRLVQFKFFDRFFPAADFWKNSNDYDNYVSTSRFLAEANNELDFDPEMKDAWTTINRALFIKFKDDVVILPQESAWWGEYDEDATELDRHDSYVYQEDLIGIRTLEETHRAQFVEWPGEHVKFNYTQINDWVIPVLRS